VYSNRGQAYYDRAWLDLQENKDPKQWFDSAAADFEKAAEKDTRDYMALDRLGLSYEQNGEPEKAIRAYTKEMALNRLGKVRLSDAYCSIGQKYHRQGDYNSAAANYQKSIEIGALPSDGCSCDAYGGLVAMYTNEERQYERAWEMVRLAQKANTRISDDLIEQLKKASGRSN
jgi:tetratricopeptide (TPR) repeat protein